MGNIAESLKENLEHILKEIPEPLHEEAKKALENVEEIARMDAEQELAAIKKELIDNPDVDESVVGDIDPAAHRPSAPPTEDEQKAAIEEALKAPPKGEAQDG